MRAKARCRSTRGTRWPRSRSWTSPAAAPPAARSCGSAERDNQHVRHWRVRPGLRPGHLTPAPRAEGVLRRRGRWQHGQRRAFLGPPVQDQVVQVPPDALPPPRRAYQQVDERRRSARRARRSPRPGAGWSAPATTRWTAAAASRPQIRPGSRRSWPRRGRSRAAAAGRRTGAGNPRRRPDGTAGRRTPRRAARGNPPRKRPPARRRAPVGEAVSGHRHGQSSPVSRVGPGRVLPAGPGRR